MASFFVVSLGLIMTLFVGSTIQFNLQDCTTDVDRQYTKQTDSHCFLFSTLPFLNRPDALTFCQDKGGQLAMPKTSESQQFLSDAITSFGIRFPLWIGLDDIQTEGEYRWLDGNLMTFDNFAPGEGTKAFSNTDSEDCVIMRPGALKNRWYDVPCVGVSYGYVCEFTKTPTTEPTTTESPHQLLQQLIEHQLLQQHLQQQQHLEQQHVLQQNQLKQQQETQQQQLQQQLALLSSLKINGTCLYA